MLFMKQDHQRSIIYIRAPSSAPNACVKSSWGRQTHARNNESIDPHLRRHKQASGSLVALADVNVSIARSTNRSTKSFAAEECVCTLPIRPRCRPSTEHAHAPRMLRRRVALHDLQMKGPDKVIAIPTFRSILQRIWKGTGLQ